jgi:rod shape-determining protein MreC
MNIVRKDSYTRGTARRTNEAVSGLHFLLMFVATVLLVLTRVEHPMVVSLQDTARKLSEPLLERISSAVEPIRNLRHNAMRVLSVDNEFRRLERELASVRQLLDRTSKLAQRNKELGELVKLVRSAPVDAVTVEVIAGAQGLFGRTVRVGAGSRDAIRYGQPVFSGKGLFGRIVSVSETTARVLVLNDINSRIPVEIGQAQHPALLVGDNTARPRLIYLNSAATVNAGDRVVTSGASGEFPRGLEVGTVHPDGEVVRVAPAGSLIAGHYLTILKYALPSSVTRLRARTAQKVPAVTGSNAVGNEKRAP